MDKEIVIRRLDALKNRVNREISRALGAAASRPEFTAKMDALFAEVQKDIEAAEEETHG